MNHSDFSPKVLVVRFRQMGDALLSTVIANSLKRSFPHCTVDYVLDAKFYALFSGHPSIDHIIAFTPDEKSHPLRYVAKVWRTVHARHYDVIIDLRSTPNTLLFALFSPRTALRIGRRKRYTHLVFNRRIRPPRPDESMVDYDLAFLAPLAAFGPIEPVRHFSLPLPQAERERFARYMQMSGLNLSRPILLVEPATRVDYKMWPTHHMAATLKQIMKTWPHLQIILNYAPGHEEQVARQLYEQLGRPAQIFIDVAARSQRDLVAMASLTTAFFGNEGGARHIAHAMGKPSFVVVAPSSVKARWLPQGDVPAEGIACTDLASPQTLAGMTYAERYALITPQAVWQRLEPFLERVLPQSASLPQPAQ